MSEQEPRENPAFRKDPGNVFIGVSLAVWLLIAVIALLYFGGTWIWSLFR